MPCKVDWVRSALRSNSVFTCVICERQVPEDEPYAFKNEGTFGTQNAHVACAFPGTDKA